MKPGSQKDLFAAGFSLIEFMLALALGLILISGAVSIYLVSKSSYTEVEQTAELAENSRFVMQVLNESLRHVGFFGSANARDVGPDAALGAVNGDCSDALAVYDPAAYSAADYLMATLPTSGKAFSCIDDAVAPNVANPHTEVLLIKHVLPRPLYDGDPTDPASVMDGVISFPTSLDGEDVYVLANTERGVLLDGADTAPDVAVGGDLALGVAWPYRMQVFYVRDLAVPTLSRKVLRWDTTLSQMTLATEDLVPGVEAMRFRFGIDSTGDGNVDSYLNSAAVTAVSGWDTVQALEVSLLLRTVREDPGYEDKKSYRLGDTDYTPGGNWRRQLLQTHVSLRNPKLTIRGGL